jgi:signal peptidase II
VTRSLRVPAAIAASVLALDQWTKHWASSALRDRAPLHVLGDLVQFTYTRNPGVAFGIGAGSHFPYWVFSVMASIAIVLLLVLRPDRPALKRAALGLILGGAVGNLIDRVRFGEVVDFILLSWRQWQFPVFNVADSAVSVGVAIFALWWAGGGPAHAPRDEPAATAD